MGSRPLEVADAFEANELFGRNGWTDGLPIVAPDEALYQKAVDAIRQCQKLLLRR